MSDAETIKAMDEEAIVATRALKTLDPEAVKAVAEWWREHYLKAGHKRLARALLGSLK